MNKQMEEFKKIQTAFTKMFPEVNESATNEVPCFQVIMKGLREYNPIPTIGLAWFLLDFVAAILDKPFEEITRGDILKYVEEQKEKLPWEDDKDD